MKHEKAARILVVFLCLALLLGVLSLNFTFSGNPASPDATATYTKNRLTWDVSTNGSGVANLGIFGSPAAGELYPTIGPLSGDKYYLRLKNDNSGSIGYRLYLYCENKDNIPLSFDLTKTSEMEDINPLDYPDILGSFTVLAACKGYVTSRNLKDFEIKWSWKSVSDAADTMMGNQAMTKDLLYTIHAMLVVEDNSAEQRDTVGVNQGYAATLYHRLYMHGYPEGDFRPDNGITRAETAAIFARILANYDETVLTQTASRFSDVSSDQWYAKYIAFLEDKDIISGYPDGSFAPNRSITRAEFATICVNYVENSTGKIRPAKIDFDDFSSDHWAYDTIRKAFAQEWVRGFPDDTLRADVPISRAEAVAVLNRILGRSADREYVDTHLDSLVRFTDIDDKNYWAYYEIYEAANDHFLHFIDNSESWFK